jgi:AcrR family transcriptional regulator
MRMFKQSSSTDTETRNRILQTAERLFAQRGFEGTTTRELALAVGVAEGTLFRHFPNKKAILTEVVTQGWIEILTDLLTELSEMANYKAIGKVMQRRMFYLHRNADRLKVCFVESQFHPDLREHIQSEVIAKMTDVAEAFFQTAIERGIYRPMNPKIVAQVFLGMFAIAGFSQDTLIATSVPLPALQEMAEGLTDIFLNGVLVKP